jgi:hypothetical protein
MSIGFFRVVFAGFRGGRAALTDNNAGKSEQKIVDVGFDRRSLWLREDICPAPPFSQPEGCGYREDLQGATPPGQSHR